MIKENINGYTVLAKDCGEKYIDVFKDVLSYNFRVEKVFRNIDDTKVLLIDTDYGKYVLKFFAPKDKLLERFLKAMFRGDDYERLFRYTEKARKNGFKKLNDFYLLAEMKILRYTRCYIMLIEYIDGVSLYSLKNVPGTIKEEVKGSIIELHENNIVSGDAHKGNFILQGDEVRLIDLSGKRASSQRRAKDFLDLKRHYGIDIPKECKDIGYYILMFRRNFRKFTHFIKGKKK